MWNIVSVPGSSSEILAQDFSLKSVPMLDVCVHSPVAQAVGCFSDAMM